MRRPSRHGFGIVVCTAMLMPCACVCVDGAFVYQVQMKLINSTAQPIPNVRVDIALTKSDLRSPSSDLLSQTDTTGHVAAVTYSRMAWGGCYPLGIIPPAPKPPRPEKLYLRFCYLTGAVVDHEVPVSDQHVRGRSPAEMQIDLGDVVAPGRTNAP